MKRILIVAMLFAAGCGGSGGTPTPTPTPTTVSLAGTVTNQRGEKVGGANVTILDGANAGQSATTANDGGYTISGLTASNGNVRARLVPYDDAVVGVYINGTNRADIVFATPACQANNTGEVAFRNTNPKPIAQDIIWDGSRIFRGVAPGQTTPPITASAGVAHTLTFVVVNSNQIACSTSSPILIQCVTGRVFTCSGP